MVSPTPPIAMVYRTRLGVKWRIGNGELKFFSSFTSGKFLVFLVGLRAAGGSKQYLSKNGKIGRRILRNGVQVWKSVCIVCNWTFYDAVGVSILFSRVDGCIVALKEIKLQTEEGVPFTAIREGKNSTCRIFISSKLFQLHCWKNWSTPISFFFTTSFMNAAVSLSSSNTW